MYLLRRVKTQKTDEFRSTAAEAYDHVYFDDDDDDDDDDDYYGIYIVIAHNHGSAAGATQAVKQSNR